MRIGGARVSATEQNLGLQHDDLKPAFDASVGSTEATLAQSTSVCRTDARELRDRWRGVYVLTGSSLHLDLDHRWCHESLSESARPRLPPLADEPTTESVSSLVRYLREVPVAHAAYTSDSVNSK